MVRYCAIPKCDEAYDDFMPLPTHWTRRTINNGKSSVDICATHSAIIGGSVAIDNPPSQLYTKEEREGMSLLSPLVDEVLADLQQANDCLVIDDVLMHIKGVFESKKQDYVKTIGYFPWIMLIRSRLVKNGFELTRGKDGLVGWKLEPVGE